MGPRATLTLVQPERRNPQTPQMWAAMAEVAAALPTGVRVLVLRAEGPSFSAGLDVRAFSPEGIPGALSLPALAALPTEQAEIVVAGYQEAFSWWRRPDLVTVAAVQGHAVGAGFQLALSADLRVLADDAQLTMAETSRGIVPDLGGTGVLVDLVGYPRALEICVTGRRVAAPEALRLGLAEVVVPQAELDAATDDLVAALLAPPAAAVAETKALLVDARLRTDDERLAAERAAQVRRLRELAVPAPAH